MSHKNGEKPAPVVLHVQVGSPIGLDPKQRVVRLTAVSESGLGEYDVLIPLCVIKIAAGDIIAKEARNEAVKIAQSTPNIVKPRIIRP